MNYDHKNDKCPPNKRQSWHKDGANRNDKKGGNTSKDHMWGKTRKISVFEKSWSGWSVENKSDRKNKINLIALKRNKSSLQTSDKQVKEILDLARIQTKLLAVAPKQLATRNRFDAFLLEEEDDEIPEAFIHPDTGATKTCVTVGTELQNETPTPIGLKVGSCSNHILESKSRGELNIKGLPKAAKTAYKFDNM